MSSRTIPHYFVCLCCGAKWFQPEAVASCSRCGTRCVSQERIAPPWWPDASSQQDASAEPPSATVEAEAIQSETQALAENNREEDYRLAYREQLRRMSCPGCGEGEPQF